MVFYPIISTTKQHKMITWGCRIVALPLVIVLFVVLIRNFYTSDPYAGMYSNLKQRLLLIQKIQLVHGVDICLASRRRVIITAKGECFSVLSIRITEAYNCCSRTGMFQVFCFFAYLLISEFRSDHCLQLRTIYIQCLYLLMDFGYHNAYFLIYRAG